MILKWIIGRKWELIGAAAALLAIWLYHTNAVSSAAKEAYERGRSDQIEADLRATLKRVEKSNEVRETVEREIRSGTGDDLYRNCLLTARTPAFCQRFLPDR
jgi:hypothetical protein